jgi:hypothetical protein
MTRQHTYKAQTLICDDPVEQVRNSVFLVHVKSVKILADNYFSWQMVNFKYFVTNFVHKLLFIFKKFDAKKRCY